MCQNITRERMLEAIEPLRRLMMLAPGKVVPRSAAEAVAAGLPPVSSPRVT